MSPQPDFFADAKRLFDLMDAMSDDDDAEYDYGPGPYWEEPVVVSERYL